MLLRREFFACVVSLVVPQIPVAELLGDEKKGDSKRAEILQKLRNLNDRATNLNRRLETLEISCEEIRQTVERCAKKQEEIAAIIREIADGERVIEQHFCAFQTLAMSVANKLEECKTELDRTNFVLQNTNCLLQHANCLLCKLPGNISRAKARAFVLGLVVGLGIGFAVGGGGGGVGTLGGSKSVSIWGGL